MWTMLTNSFKSNFLKYQHGFVIADATNLVVFCHVIESAGRVDVFYALTAFITANDIVKLSAVGWYIRR